jgi:phage terminase Nu1 subunit (DNA packaging protein)
MSEDDDLFGDVVVVQQLLEKPKRMRGQGRKGKDFEDEVRSVLINEGDLDYQVARARKEAWQAKTVELDYHIKQGTFVSRDEVRQACATAYSSLAQSLRSIPDAMERREGIAPEIAEKVGIVIDEVLGDLAASFENLMGQHE